MISNLGVVTGYTNIETIVDAINNFKMRHNDYKKEKVSMLQKILPNLQYCISDLNEIENAAR